MKVIVSKKNEKYGPFEISQVQYYVDVGFFQLTDFCFIEGWKKWEMLSSIVSRMPRFEIDVRHRASFDPSTQESLPPEDSEKFSAEASYGLHSDQISDPSPGQVQEQDQNPFWEGGGGSQGLDAQKFSNMASFGFFNLKNKSVANKLIYLARNGEILECCPRHEITNKLSSGQLLPDDWFFDESTREWKRLRQSSW